MPKPAKKPRSITTTIRMSVEDHEYLKAFAARTGVTLSGLFKTSLRIAMGIPVREDANIRKFENIQKQLFGAAHNLNQITRAANAGRFKMGGHAEAVINDLAEEVRRTHDLFAEYRKAAHARDLISALQLAEALDERMATDG